MDVENFAINEFAGTLSNFAFDKKVLKYYLFVIVCFEKKVRVNVFFKGGFSFSFLSEKRKLENILIDIGLGDQEVKEIVKTATCVYLDKTMIKE